MGQVLIPKDASVSRGRIFPSFARAWPLALGNWLSGSDPALCCQSLCHEHTNHADPLINIQPVKFIQSLPASGFSSTSINLPLKMICWKALWF